MDEEKKGFELKGKFGDEMAKKSMGKGERISNEWEARKKSEGRNL